MRGDGGAARRDCAVLCMRSHRTGAFALLLDSICLVLFAVQRASAQYVDPPSTAPNFWLGVGAGAGTDGGSSAKLLAGTASAWISRSIVAGGVRVARVEAYDYGDKADDFAVLVGLRTPPSFAALIGTVGYSSLSTRCQRSPCPAGYSPAASGATAFSLQARVNFSIIGLGVEVLGARGMGLNSFTARTVTLQIGSFAH